MKIAPVQQGNIDISAAKSLGGVEPAKSPTDDDHSMGHTPFYADPAGRVENQLFQIQQPLHFRLVQVLDLDPGGMQIDTPWRRFAVELVDKCLHGFVPHAVRVLYD